MGELQEARDGARETLEVPRHILAADPSAYALRIRGESMSPLMQEGDAVVVSPAAEIFDGCLVAAYVEPDGDVVKRLHFLAAPVERGPRAPLPGPAGGDDERTLKELGAREALLLPANPAYPVIRIGGEGGREARIWGRVVLLLREL